MHPNLLVHNGIGADQHNCGITTCSDTQPSATVAPTSKRASAGAPHREAFRWR